VLNRETEAPDINVLRAVERIEKTKKIIADNKRLEEGNYLYASKINAQSQNALPHHTCKQGDIFDSLFERPAHWKNVTCQFDFSFTRTSSTPIS
jgi:hypothetical protein